MNALYLYSFPQEGEVNSLPTDLTEPLTIKSKGFFRVVYTTIFEYGDHVREIAYWNTGLDRWELCHDNGLRLRGTFTDFSMMETSAVELG